MRNAIYILITILLALPLLGLVVTAIVPLNATLNTVTGILVLYCWVYGGILACVVGAIAVEYEGVKR